MTMGIACRAAFAALWLVASAASAAPAPSILDLAGHRITVEVADTPAALRRGLMGRRSLAADNGMWFVFDHAASIGFWMKNTPLSLDILFFDATGHLVTMKQDAPPCLRAPCPIYMTVTPASYVLEVPAGTAHRLGIKLGDSAKLLPNARVLGLCHQSPAS